jgi:hypothetical protein
MKQYPPVPRVADAPPGLFDSGHLWIQEQVDGAHLRFQLRESGMLEFGSRSRVYRDAAEIPDPYHHAVRHVRQAFDREALRAARDDVESVVFFGVATQRRVIDYDWDRTPSFLGFDVWDSCDDGGSGEGKGESEDDGTANESDGTDDGRFLPPDAVEQAFDQLGLDAVNTFQKEVRATDFDPEDYEIPQSEWYDGPAAGVVVRNKTGQRATLRHPDFREAEDATSEERPAEASNASVGESAEELAQEFVTRQRVEQVARELEASGQSVGFDAVFERVVEDVIREEYDYLFDGDEPDDAEWSVDAGAFRSEAAARTQQFLDD